MHERFQSHQLTRAHKPERLVLGRSCVLVACITSSGACAPQGLGSPSKQSCLGSSSFRSQRAWQNKEDECRNTGCISNEDDTVMPCCLASENLVCPCQLNGHAYFNTRARLMRAFFCAYSISWLAPPPSRHLCHLRYIPFYRIKSFIQCIQRRSKRTPGRGRRRKKPKT